MYIHYSLRLYPSDQLYYPNHHRVRKLFCNLYSITDMIIMSMSQEYMSDVFGKKIFQTDVAFGIVRHKRIDQDTTLLHLYLDETMSMIYDLHEKNKK